MFLATAGFIVAMIGVMFLIIRLANWASKEDEGHNGVIYFGSECIVNDFCHAEFASKEDGK